MDGNKKSLIQLLFEILDPFRYRPLFIRKTDFFVFIYLFVYSSQNNLFNKITKTLKRIYTNPSSN